VIKPQPSLSFKERDLKMKKRTKKREGTSKTPSTPPKKKEQYKKRGKIYSANFDSDEEDSDSDSGSSTEVEKTPKASSSKKKDKTAHIDAAYITDCNSDSEDEPVRQSSPDDKGKGKSRMRGQDFLKRDM
jgi:hypothetical protein